MTSPLALSSRDILSLELNRGGDRFVAHIYQLFQDRKSMPSYHASHSFPLYVAERRRGDGLNKWEFAATDFTAKMIIDHWPPEQLRLSKEAETTLTYLLLTIKNREENARTVARYEEGDGVFRQEYDVHEEFPLARYQRVALVAMMRSEGYSLFMEQGTGKTPIVIAAICNSAKNLSEDRMYRAIIVTPNSVRLNWQREFEKFATVPGQTIVLRGGEIRRAKLLIDAFTPDNGSKYTVVICGYDTLPTAWTTLRFIEWDFGVLDESHWIKNPRTRRAKFALRLRDQCRKRACLTGTPITNHALDLYSQFEFLGCGWSGFNSWGNFRSFYGKFRPSGTWNDRLVGIQNLPLMKERLTHLSYSIKKERALPDLPEKVYDIHEVEMTDQQQEYYDKVRKHLLLEIEHDFEEAKNKALVVQNILVKLLRLAQITSGFIVWDSKYDMGSETFIDAAIEYFDPNPKMDALLDLLREKKLTEKTIVWACWVPNIIKISEMLTTNDINHVTYYGGMTSKAREEAVDRFNEDPSCMVFDGNPAAGGIGLNLLGYPPHLADEYTTNCDHLLYYSQNWPPTVRWQSEDRAHRRGTRKVVRITDLCVPNTIDEEIRARVLQKKIAAVEMGDVRDILKSLLRKE